MLYFLRIFAAPIFLNTFLQWKYCETRTCSLTNMMMFSDTKPLFWKEYARKIIPGKVYSVVIAMLYIMTKLNVILRLELVSVQICPHWQEKGSKEKSAVKDHCFFVRSRVFLWWFYRFQLWVKKILTLGKIIFILYQV